MNYQTSSEREFPFDLKVSAGLFSMITILIIAVAFNLKYLLEGMFIGFILLGFLSISSISGLLKSLSSDKAKRSTKHFVLRIIFCLISLPNFGGLCWIAYGTREYAF